MRQVYINKSLFTLLWANNMWLTIEKLIALPCAKRRVRLILETNSACKINRHHHHPNSERARGSGFTWDKNYRGGDYSPPWLPDVTCSVLHSRDNYHINLINGHPGGTESHAELRRYSSQVRLFHLVSHEGDTY